MNKYMGAVVSTLIFSATAFAAEPAKQSVLPRPRPVAQSSEWKPHFGVVLGAAQPERSGVTASEIGIDIGYQPYIPYGLGAEFIHSRIDDREKVADRNTLWLKCTYNFGGTQTLIKDSYVGLGLGAVFKSDGTSAAAAPLIGFDIPMKEEDGKTLTLGMNSRYAVVADDEVDTFSITGVLKYWY